MSWKDGSREERRRKRGRRHKWLTDSWQMDFGAMQKVLIRPLPALTWLIRDTSLLYLANRTQKALLPLPDITAEGLLTAKGLQAEYFERINELRRKKGKTGSEWHLEQTDETSVITAKCSERIKPGSLSRWWSLERGNYGLDDSSLHELRHTCLTLLAEEGVHPKVMQELVGHYTSQITMDVCTHVNMDAKREAVTSVS